MNAKELYLKETGKDRTRACFEQIPSVTEHYISWLETKVAEQHQALQLQQTGVMGSILSVANGWGEASTFYKVGSYYEKVEIAKIQQETKVLGAGYYNDLTINCYVGYSNDGKKLFEINDGANVEVRYCP